MSATLEATAGLFARYESEIQALEARQRAAEQNVKALTETQAELQHKIDDLLLDLRSVEGKITEAQARSEQILADAQRDAHQVRMAAAADTEALRKKAAAAIQAAQRAFEELQG
jgi:predicted  nucleic acid-binding Zn-ribbon protein